MEMQKTVPRIAIFSALAIALGYVLSPVPNIEMMTPTIFLSGALFGILPGILVGTISFLIFGFFNPMGSSPLPLLMAQVVGGIIVGWGGGIYHQMKVDRVWLLIIMGILLTLLYDILTSAAGWFFFPSKKTFVAYILVGLPFILIHIGTQAFAYGVIIYSVHKKLKEKEVK